MEWNSNRIKVKPLKKPYLIEDLNKIHLLDSDEGAEFSIASKFSDSSEHHFWDGKRIIVSAWNEGGHNGTEVDLLDILRSTKQYLPELWDEVANDRNNSMRTLWSRNRN
jgi:hypothetical protein